MRIGILTFHRAINAGAVLQAYAMQEFLRLKGFDASIIDYAPGYIENAYAPVRSLSIRHPFGALYEISTAYARFERKKKFRRFINEFFNLDSLPNLMNYDYVILGSDQIWNSSITRGRLDPIFFNQHPEYKAKNSIAYAASTMSVNRLTDSDLSDMSVWLKTIKAIGVRERSLADLIRTNFNMPNSEVLDPTLLPPRTIYDKLVGEPIIKGDYLLFYEVWHNRDVELTARKIAERKGLKFVGLSGSDIRLAHKDIIQQFSPSDFVNLVAHSSHVVTSSFHGTAFALIFEKQFNVVCEEPHQAVRMQDLLKKIDCLDKFSYKLDPVSDRVVNFEEINEILLREREISIKFLIDNLI